MKYGIILLGVLGTISNNFANTTNIKTLQKRSLGYLLYTPESSMPLLAHQEYNSGPIDASEYSLISVLLTGTPANSSGTLYLEFSPDSTHWDQVTEIPVNNLTQEPPHTAIPVSRYSRIRYVNGPIDQSEFRLQAVYHRQSAKGLTSRLEQTINATTDVENVRAVIVGRNSAGTYKNVLIGNNNGLDVNIRESSTAFGEISVAEPTSIVQLDYLYGLHPTLISTQQYNLGVITTEDNMIKLSTGNTAPSGATARSVALVNYNPGQGAFCRFSALFTEGVTGSTQYVGVGTESNGYFFGYKDNQFGILRRRGGSPEARKLTITQASNTNENIIITLDGQNKSIAITNSNNATVTANEIAAADYSNTGSGWTAHASGNSVTFISWNASSHAGLYALSNATTARGSFVQEVAGTSTTEFFTPQTQWNVDQYNSTGVSNITLNPTKGNVYQIRWQWLGFGMVTYSIENPITGRFDRVHQEHYANANTIPSVASPQLPLYYSVFNTSNTENITLRSGSAAGFVDGKETFNGVRGGATGSKDTVGATEIPIFTLRNKVTYQGKINYRKTKINIVTVSSTHSKAVELRSYGGGKLTNANFIDTNNFSNTEYDTSATEHSGGLFLFNITLPPNSSHVFFLTTDKYSGILSPGGFFTTTARNIENSVTGRVTVSYNFVELR